MLPCNEHMHRAYGKSTSEDSQSSFINQHTQLSTHSRTVELAASTRSIHSNTRPNNTMIIHHLLQCSVCLWVLLAIKLLTVDAFSIGSLFGPIQQRRSSRPVTPFRAKGSGVSDLPNPTSLSMEESIKVNDLLSDLPTPALLIELSLAESAVAVNQTSSIRALDEFLQQSAALSREEITKVLDGTLFVHTAITDTSERDRINEEQGSGKSLTIGRVDCSVEMIPGGAFLGIGLANHHVGGYYWARGMGMGASLPAHGVEFRAHSEEHCDGDGELYWKKRGPGLDATETTEESSNSNDGKRSEWADFLSVGDTVQLVPCDPATVFLDAPFQRLVGVRRIGRPLGADPIVEEVWKRQTHTGESGMSAWVPC